jgi:hypothetical protein
MLGNFSAQNTRSNLFKHPETREKVHLSNIFRVTGCTPLTQKTKAGREYPKAKVPSPPVIPSMNPLSTRPSRWRPITVFNLLVGLLFSLSALGQSSSLKSNYQVIDGEFTWQQAQADAIKRGGYLATITTGEEQSAVKAIIDSKSYWIGATDFNNEGQWEWVTGESFKFSNWLGGEPNGLRIENYLEIAGSVAGKWNDNRGNQQIGYILEIPNSNLNPPDNSFITNGLVAYYPFNGNANDESGNVVNGVVVDLSYGVNRFNQPSSSGVFNGSSSIIECKTPSSGGNYTLSAWVRIPSENVLTGIDKGWYAIYNSGNYPQEAALGINPGLGYIRNQCGGGLIDVPLLRSDFLRWMHVVAVWKDGLAKITIDGQIRETVGIPIKSNNTPVASQQSIGFVPNPKRNLFKGEMDDLRIYNRVLSDYEVAALYKYESTPLNTVPVFVNQPQSQSLTAGNDATFCVTLKDAGNYNYQWQRNEQNIAGATLNCYTINSVTAAMDGGRYRVIVSNSAGTIISDNATLSVVTPPPPTIATQPTPKTVQEGANVSLSVVASGQGTLVYQWQFNEQNLPGATSSTLNLNGVKLNTAGRYRVLVSSQYGVTISDTVTLTVNPNPPPTIVTQPLSRTPAEGTQVSLTVTATGLGSLTYQWQVNGQNIPAATSSTLVLSAVRPSVNGNYRVIVGNPYGTTISTEATVTVIVTDSDSDGLSDYEELLLGTNANKADSDGDGLSDFAEVRTHQSNPLTTDTDGDGYSDGIEVARDGNPNNRSVTPTGALAVFPAVDVEFYTLNSVKYQLEVSTDMVSWTAQGGVVVGTGGNQNHLVRASKATQFWRLKVVQ